jgi:septal ring factor EnvC (AmiA/AmiB activator)
MEQAFDLTNLSRQMLGTVPLWFFAWAIFKAWRDQSTKNKEMIEAQFESQKEAMLAIHEKLNRIEMKLASQGVDNLKEDIETLKKESVENETKLEAIFRILDQSKLAIAK